MTHNTSSLICKLNHSHISSLNQHAYMFRQWILLYTHIVYPIIFGVKFCSCQISSTVLESSASCQHVHKACYCLNWWLVIAGNRHNMLLPPIRHMFTYFNPSLALLFHLATQTLWPSMQLWSKHNHVNYERLNRCWFHLLVWPYSTHTSSFNHFYIFHMKLTGSHI